LDVREGAPNRQKSAAPGIADFEEASRQLEQVGYYIFEADG
jgi:hypothetical protein